MGSFYFGDGTGQAKVILSINCYNSTPCEVWVCILIHHWSTFNWNKHPYSHIGNFSEVYIIDLAPFLHSKGITFL